MEARKSPPFVVTLDDSDDPVDVIDALVLSDFIAGAHRFARSVWLRRVRDEATLLPAGAEVELEAHQNGMTSRLARGDGWVLRSIRFSDATAKLTVTARSDALAATILEQAGEGVVEPAPPEDEAAEIGFWHVACTGPRRAARSLEIEPWAAIRANYAAAGVGALDRLMALSPKDLRGRLLLLHGPPGTGKTTALRALAHAWQDWCDVDYVLDPERMLRDPSYLLHVLLHDDDDDDDEERWRLLVLEDCDELIRTEAKKETGQGLARLLNLTDGLVGQGLNVVVCITTNEELARLHPAVTRPGRCLAQVCIGRLNQAEATRWLGGTKGINADGATLAELYALRGDIEKLGDETRDGHTGLYL